MVHWGRHNKTQALGVLRLGGVCSCEMRWGIINWRARQLLRRLSIWRREAQSLKIRRREKHRQDAKQRRMQRAFRTWYGGSWRAVRLCSAIGTLQMEGLLLTQMRLACQYDSKRRCSQGIARWHALAEEMPWEAHWLALAKQHNHGWSYRWAWQHWWSIIRLAEQHGLRMARLQVTLRRRALITWRAQARTWHRSQVAHDWINQWSRTHLISAAWHAWRMAWMRIVDQNWLTRSRQRSSAVDGNASAVHSASRNSSSRRSTSRSSISIQSSNEVAFPSTLLHYRAELSSYFVKWRWWSLESRS